MAIIRTESQHSGALDKAFDRARRQRDLIESRRKAREPFESALKVAEVAAPVAGMGLGAAIGGLAGGGAGAVPGATIGAGLGTGVSGLLGLGRDSMGAEDRSKEQEEAMRRQALFQLLGSR